MMLLDSLTKELLNSLLARMATLWKRWIIFFVCVLSQNMYSHVRHFNHKSATCNIQSVLNFTQGPSMNFTLNGINFTTILSNSQLLVKTRSLWKTRQLNWSTTSC
jgi:hypothetical protein